MKLTIPDMSLVVLIGASGSGKSSFARRHFKPTEVLSSDVCRGLVSDDDTDQTATPEAFEVLHFIAAKRLARGRLTVVDGTNVQPEARRPLVALARSYHMLPVAVVLKTDPRVCLDRNAARPDRTFGPHVVIQQTQQLRRSLGGLQKEGFRHVFVLESPEDVEAAVVERQPLWNNRKADHGPFDVVGDVHGCCDELGDLLGRLGYQPGEDGTPRHPGGRRAVFVGDLVDRGPRILDTVRLVRRMVEAGSALCVPGNHDIKFMRALRGKKVTVSHGLDRSLAEVAALPGDERARTTEEVARFFDDLVSHYVFDDGRLVVAHAGLKEAYQGRGSGTVREFCLYGETTGETDEAGVPVRAKWAAEYRGRALVVYGHTAVAEPEWLNNTVDIDTGCVYGGKLTAFRYPERELVSVPARAVYCQPARPLAPPAPAADGLTAQQAHDDLLDIADVLGKRIISTRLHPAITIREEHAAAALELLSRFAVNPKWLIYLPPTMAPCETSRLDGLLEHPAEAFRAYRDAGVDRVVCEEKHMGSRAVVVVCKDEAATAARFGVTGEGVGAVMTRTGRRFFTDPGLEADLIDRLRAAAGRAGLWDHLATDWLCLDCELMPWSAKAQELIREQYAAVGAAATAALPEAVKAFRSAAGVPDIEPLTAKFAARLDDSARFVEAYRRYCWPVGGVGDLRLAPFHVLAGEGAAYFDKDHLWHLEVIDRLRAAAGETGCPLHPTRRLVVETAAEESVAAGVRWWEELTAAGGEGMVVKPLAFVPTGSVRGVQPAVKVRGPEYLRIIYGPDYRSPEHLTRLRQRGLGHKRSLALREFALGVEAVERFVRREPLRKVHECVFGVLALESDPVDPRL